MFQRLKSRFISAKARCVRNSFSNSLSLSLYIHIRICLYKKGGILCSDNKLFVLYEDSFMASLAHRIVNTVCHYVITVYNKTLVFLFGLVNIFGGVTFGLFNNY